MTRSMRMLSATLMLGAGLGAAGAAYAAPEAKLNKCWGLVTKQFAATGTIGEHAKDPPGFEPGTGGRDGVGNVSKTGQDNETGEPFGELSEGAQGAHAIDVGEDMGLACEDPAAGVP